MNKWTPGPWKGDAFEVWSTRSVRINLTTVATPRVAMVDDHNAEDFSAKSTAHLIAAAPELYEALEKLVSEFGGSLEQLDRIGPDLTCADGAFVSATTLEDRREFIEAASAALAKARGEK